MILQSKKDMALILGVKRETFFEYLSVENNIYNLTDHHNVGRMF